MKNIHAAVMTLLLLIGMLAVRPNFQVNNNLYGGTPLPPKWVKLMIISGLEVKYSKYMT